MIQASKGTVEQVQLLTVNEAARFCGISTRTMWRLVSTGDVPKPVSVGARLRRWKRLDLEAWVESLGD